YPAFMKARELVTMGAIGEFRGMRTFLLTPVNYMTSRRNHWAHRLPGGMIGESGPHVIYLSLAFISPIVEIQVHAQKLLPEFQWSQFEDYRVELFGETAASSVTLAYTTNQWAATVDIWGDHGLIQVDLETQSLVCHNRRDLRPLTVGLSGLHEAFQL